jgi:beta-phosphoglucomutase-like phosphatase (HAD superfamily)
MRRAPTRERGGGAPHIWAGFRCTFVPRTTLGRMPDRARRERQREILEAVLATASARAPEGVCVFDLDSTVLDNRPRQARILADYGRTAGEPLLLEARPEHFQGWNLAAALANAGLAQEEVRAHLRPFRRFWDEWFFTSAYCRLDAPIPGAPAFLGAVAGAGARIAYVTGRPRSMLDGTLAAFRRAEMPVPDDRRVVLLMKDAPELKDDAWKRRACATIARLGPVIAVFDNEPAHVNLYAERWPDALAVHLDTDHSGRPVDVLARIPSIADFVRE